MRSLPAGLIAMALGAVLVHSPAAGQTHAEIRGGLMVGSHTGTAAGLDFAPALSYEALVMRQITPRLSVYGGYVRSAFGCEEGFCIEQDLIVTGTHGVLGAVVHSLILVQKQWIVVAQCDAGRFQQFVRCARHLLKSCW